MREALKYLQAGAIVPVDMETTILLVNALKEALAQPAQEPWPEEPFGHMAGGVQPPQRPWVLQREWVDLTDEEIDKWAHELHGVIYAVMADLNEKNNAA